ncbi:MAG: hypothetical protein ACE5ER_11355 [Nitrospinaceae bacterium]
MRFKKGVSVGLVATVFFGLLSFGWSLEDAEAVSQWARKYKVDCSTCHVAFPRLNYFGEKFMRNGFQWPGQPPDGDTEGKEQVGENLFIDQVGHWFGARLEMTPLEYQKDSVTKNGVLTDSLDVGNTNSFQFFVAGSIFKNVSIFIEQEFKTEGAETNWYHLAFTNLWDTYANVQVGRISPVDFTPFSDRLRVWQKSDILNVKSANGAGENSVTIRQPRPGIQYYGYKGPVVWFAGLDNGKDASDTDRDKNFWGGARLYVPASIKTPFEGSSVGFHYYAGTDTSGGLAGSPAGAPGIQVENDFRRYTVSGNVRYKTNLDFLFTYQFGEDDNFNFSAPTPTQVQFDGYTLISAYRHLDWYFVLQYDKVDSNDVAGLDVEKFSPSVWYFLRDNFKVGLASRWDLENSLVQNHEVSVRIRTMF